MWDLPICQAATGCLRAQETGSREQRLVGRNYFTVTGEKIKIKKRWGLNYLTESPYKNWLYLPFTLHRVWVLTYLITAQYFTQMALVSEHGHTMLSYLEKGKSPRNLNLSLSFSVSIHMYVSHECLPKGILLMFCVLYLYRTPFPRNAWDVLCWYTVGKNYASKAILCIKRKSQSKWNTS